MIFASTSQKAFATENQGTLRMRRRPRAGDWPSASPLPIPGGAGNIGRAATCDEEPTDRDANADVTVVAREARRRLAY
jgi:hypothetical protein